jgi:hypothetical protein
MASVVLHGITAGPGGRRYVQHERADSEAMGLAAPRGLIGRGHGG